MDLGIYYIHRAGEEIQLRFLNFATDKSTIVARNVGTSELGLTATPDGRTILYTRIEPPAGDIMLAENFR